MLIQLLHVGCCIGRKVGLWAGPCCQQMLLSCRWHELNKCWGLLILALLNPAENVSDCGYACSCTDCLLLGAGPLAFECLAREHLVSANMAVLVLPQAAGSVWVASVSKPAQVLQYGTSL